MSNEMVMWRRHKEAMAREYQREREKNGASIKTNCISFSLSKANEVVYDSIFHSISISTNQ
jgi:hypothetical protein